MRVGLIALWLIISRPSFNKGNDIDIIIVLKKKSSKKKKVINNKPNISFLENFYMLDLEIEFPQHEESEMQQLDSHPSLFGKQALQRG